MTFGSVIGSILLATFVSPVSAEPNVLKPEAVAIYQETGQIVFDSVELKNINGNLEIKSYSNSVQAEALSNKLEDAELQGILADYMAQGKTPVAVGWTTVYLKDSSNPNANGQVELMTISDVQNDLIMPYGTGTGNTEKKGNFTLYTLAGFDNYNPSALFAQSVGKAGYINVARA